MKLEIDMKLTVAKWGHSAALRLPRAILEQLSTQIGGELDVTLENGKLVLEPAKPDLYELLSRITPENRHAELITGTIGKEII